MHRDLACEELWAQSLARSRARREAAAAASGVRLPVRSLSVAAVVAVSGGNHGIAVAEVAGGMDVRATVVMARSAPPRSIERIRAARDADAVFAVLMEAPTPRAA